MGDVTGTLQSDARIRVAGGARLQGEVRLPQLDGVTPHEQSFLETQGRLLGEHPLLASATTLTGAGAGALLARGGPFKRIGVALAGAAAALVGTALIMHGVQKLTGTGAADTSRHVASNEDAGSTPRVGARGEQVRMMNWNAHDLLGPDGSLGADGDGLAAIRATVEREQPDVLVLQEVSQGGPLDGGRDGLGELAEALGATDAVLVPNGVQPGGKAKGGAILTFGDARIQDARGLRHVDGQDQGFVRSLVGMPGALRLAGVDVPEWVPRIQLPRTSSDAIVTTAGGTDIRVLGVHLSGTVEQGGDVDAIGRLQSAQLGPIARSLDAWQGPTFLSGDFNIKDTSSEYETERALLEDAGMRDAFTESGVAPGDESRRSFPAAAPTRSIDRAWVSAQLAVDDVRVVSTGDARAGSDHLPIVTDVTIQ